MGRWKKLKVEKQPDGTTLSAIIPGIVPAGAIIEQDLEHLDDGYIKYRIIEHPTETPGDKL